MQSKFEINPLRKKRLMELLITLFPEYNIIRIKQTGLISFGNKLLLIPIIKHKVHISELCLDEIPKRLGKYRQGNIKSYVQLTNQYLEYIITNHVCNVIDYLYQEFSNIKSSSRVDALLEDAHLSLIESKPDSETIGVIIKQIIRKPDLSDIINLLNKVAIKEPIKDQYRRLSFLSKSIL